MVNEFRIGRTGGSVQFYTNVTADDFDFLDGFALNFPLVTSPYMISSPSMRHVPALTAEDTLSWLRGKHSITFGGSYTRLYTSDFRLPVMIGYLEGPIHSLQPDKAIVLAGGVGYHVNIPLTTYYRLEGEKTARLLVYTHVREDVISLYGFFTANEKLAFEKLISISGIGPRLAQVILSGIEVTELAAAITQGDTCRLSAIPGVGKKTAERMCLELRDKLVIIDMKGAPAPPKPKSSVDDDAISALVNLGYRRWL